MCNEEREEEFQGHVYVRQQRMDLGGCGRTEKNLGCRSRKGVRMKSLRPLASILGQA